MFVDKCSYDDVHDIDVVIVALIDGTSSEHVLAETVIPVCPPACGQARYSSAVPVSTSNAVIFFSALFFLFKMVCITHGS